LSGTEDSAALAAVDDLEEEYAAEESLIDA
jgi:hypothetical protein